MVVGLGVNVWMHETAAEEAVVLWRMCSDKLDENAGQSDVLDRSGSNLFPARGRDCTDAKQKMGRQVRAKTNGSNEPTSL